MNMNLLDISQKILRRKNYFPRILCFSPAISLIHKSTKMRFPRNQPEMVQLHKNIASSKIVVRGWYMTLFDRRDLLNSGKMFGAVSPTFPTFPDRFVIFLDFFENFVVDHESSKNRLFGLPSPKKMFKN